MKGHLRIVVLTMVLLSTSLFMLFCIIYKEPILGFYIYWNCQEVTIKNNDTLKIPKRWDCFSEDNKTYIVNEQGEPVIIETSGYTYSEDWMTLEEDNNFFSAEVRIKGLYGCGFSNSASMLKVVMEDDERKREGYVLSFPTSGYAEEYHFIVWDSEIDERKVEKIVWSFYSGD